MAQIFRKFALTQINMQTGNHQRGTVLHCLVLVIVLICGKGQAAFVAFNDHSPTNNTSLTHSNATTYNALANAGGPLRNITNGTLLTAGVRITNSAGALGAGGAGVPNAGTPLANTFNGFVYFGNTSNNSTIQITAGAVVTYTFTNLDSSKRYSFKGGAVRGGSGGSYPNRWTRVSLVGAASFNDAHSTGVITRALGPTTDLTASDVAFNSGQNLIGDMVDWEDIEVPSGSFAVISRMWTNTTVAFPGYPGGGLATNTPPYGFALSGFKLEQMNPRPIVITRQPTNQISVVGEAVTFDIGLSGAGPHFFQWRKNAAPIAGATNLAYTITSTMAGDAGTYSLVVSNSFSSATSSNAVLTVTNGFPIAITQPLQSLIADEGLPATFAVTVNGTPPIFFRWFKNGSLIANATNQNLSFPQTTLGDAGFYSVVVSNQFSSELSGPVTLHVAAKPISLVPLTNLWKYDQSARDLGTNWKEALYDDASWPSGRGVLAFENNPLVTPLINTTLSLRNERNVFVTNFYFRTHFTFTNDPNSFSLIFSNLIDDGAVFYLNGDELFRLNMPQGAITANTFALGFLSEGVFVSSKVPTPPLKQGDNIMAVEVHQVNDVNSDIVFGTSVSASLPPFGPLIFTNQPASRDVVEGTPVTFIAQSLGSPPLFRQWFKNGEPIPGATSESYSIANALPGDSGVYFLQVSNASGRIVSSNASLFVISLQAPSLSLTRFTNEWKFNQSGADLGTIWREPAYNDSFWQTGQGVFTVPLFSGVPEPTNPALLITNSSGQAVVTYYFRTHLYFPYTNTDVVLVASYLLDDGAIFYLNGLEMGRIRMGSGPANYLTRGEFSPNSGRAYEVWNFLSTGLLTGDNILAVEVHQASAGGSIDLTFGLALKAVARTNQPVSIVSQPPGQTIAENQSVSFSADVFGTVPVFFQWLKNGIPTPGATNQTFNIAYSHGFDSGAYSFIASNQFNSVVSSNATLTVIPDAIAPVMVSAQGNTLYTVLVAFSEAVDTNSLTNLANYSFNPRLTVLNVQIVNPTTILLTTSKRDPQFNYTLTVNGLTDTAIPANPIAPGSTMAVHVNSGGSSSGLLRVQTVFIILMENHDWKDIRGSTNCPYINNSLLPVASSASQYYTAFNLHPSEPNYIWLEAGANFGILDDAEPSSNHISSTNHLTTMLDRAGVSWKTYQENITGLDCPTNSNYPYAAKHNPFVFFDDVIGDGAYCINHMRPYTELAADLASHNIARYNFITPNLTNDMHDTVFGGFSSARLGDNWLSREVPQILASDAFQNNGALFITWDEGTSASPIGMIVISPLARGNGYTNTIYYTHSSTLRTMQDIFGVQPYLGDAINAASLGDLFTSVTLRSATPLSGGQYQFTLDHIIPQITTYIQASTDLVNWTSIWTNAPTATSLIFTDPDAPNFTHRFYRVLQVP